MYSLNAAELQDLNISTQREWLLTDGQGGFAMGSAADIPTRRYHGLLFKSARGTLDRILTLTSIEAAAEFNGNSYPLSSNQYPGAVFPEGYRYLTNFVVTSDYIEWTYLVEGAQIRKRIVFVESGRAIRIQWHNDSNRPFRLALRPLTAHRSYHGNAQESSSYPHDLIFGHEETRIEHEGMTLLVKHPGAYRTSIEGWYYRFEHVREAERGLDPRDDLYCPCELAFVLMPEESAGITAEIVGSHELVSGRTQGVQNDLLEAATSPFLVAIGDRPTIIAGYPWFTDWGRDTMISLPGLCLVSGRFDLARSILFSYASHLSEGMIPNRIVESGEAEYNSVDSTLWFVNAIYRTLKADWNEEFAEKMFAALIEIYAWHTKGTRFNIKVDAKDGLLSQGDSGVQLTWMDAKIGDWVVTPRRGKAVEVVALWINALRITEWVANRLGQSTEKFRSAAEKAEGSFEKKFWRKKLGYYLDIADPDDASFRPNQVIAMGLPFAPHGPENAIKALERVAQELATPYGLRTLTPSDLSYKGRFEGPLTELDASYHQGTVWPWLLGSYADAIFRFTGDAKRALGALSESDDMLAQYGFGGIAEVYDGDEPHRPSGCPWQAWSVAEILRARNEIRAASGIE